MAIESYAVLESRTLTERAKLVDSWSTWFYDHTDTFEGKLGTQLAYLWPAIIKAHKIEAYDGSAIVRLLRHEEVPVEAVIWEYIDVIAGSEDEEEE
jgi:hypothetical protein